MGRHERPVADPERVVEPPVVQLDRLHRELRFGQAERDENLGGDRLREAARDDLVDEQTQKQIAGVAVLPALSRRERRRLRERTIEQTVSLQASPVRSRTASAYAGSRP